MCVFILNYLFKPGFMILFLNVAFTALPLAYITLSQCMYVINMYYL